MSKKTVSLHRALSELKLIDSRLTKLIASYSPLTIKRDGDILNSKETVDEFVARSKAELQTINDLIKRKNDIKNKIVISNANTEVEVAGKKMTIADAINFKTLIVYKKSLYDVVHSSLSRATHIVEVTNEKVDREALALAEKIVGKDVKVASDDVKAVTDLHKKKHSVELVDAIDAEAWALAYQTEIDVFESEVDSVLSEANASTTIEI